MPEATKNEKRQCPGEKYEISIAICRARQANNYPKCLLCKYREEDEAEGHSGDPKIKKTIFRDSEILGSVPGEINEYVMRKVGTAAAQFLRSRTEGKPTMVVGCDRRANSRNLARNFAEGVNAGGFHTYQLGVTTPSAVHFALKHHQMGSAAFITGCSASSQINGVRLFLKDGMPLGLEDGLDKIGLIARRVKLGPRHSRGQNKSLDVMEDYRSFLKRISPNIKPTKVALDASDGAAGEIWPFLCAGMPIEFVRTHCEPEERSPLLGRPFPGSAVTRALRNSTVESGAGFGVAVDFDGDICQFFDEKGNMLPGGIASALIARTMAEKKSDMRILYDVRSTAVLREEVKAAGGEAIPCAGDKISLAKSLVSKEAAYAVDVYGRHFFRDVHCAESPALAMLYLCSAVSRSGKALSQLANDIGRYTTTGVLQYNMPSRRDAIETIERLERKFTKAQKHTLYGLKFQFSDWWFHVRNPASSATLQLVVEGRSESDCRKGRKTVEDIIKG